MAEKQGALARPPRRKRHWPKHNLYSWIDSKRMPEGRSFQRIRQELAWLRTELIEVHGGDEEISPAARIMVDSVIESLGVQKMMTLYCRKFGMVDQHAAHQGRLELSPILGKNYVSYGNSVRQGLLALKELSEKREGAEMTPIEILAEAVRDEEAGRTAAEDPGAPGRDDEPSSGSEDGPEGGTS
jgi:hypothetical protein